MAEGGGEPAAIDDAGRGESHFVGFFQVGLDYGFDVAGQHAVDVEDIGDRNANRSYELPKPYTKKQGQYLSFIAYYALLRRLAPAEWEI